MNESSSSHMQRWCPWTEHWTDSLSCGKEHLLNAWHWRLVKMDIFCCITWLLVIKPFKWKSRVIHHLLLHCWYSIFICVHVFTWWWYSCGRVCGLLLSGSSNQPSDKGCHYFGFISIQVAKQTLFNDRKQNTRGREWLLMIICVSQAQTQGQLFIYI